MLQWNWYVQYIPRNMHTVFALLCFVVVIHWLIFPYPSGLLHWHCGNLTIASVPAKQPWWIWIDTSCEFIMNDCITTTKQSTTKPCAYFLGYTVCETVATTSTEFILSNELLRNICFHSYNYQELWCFLVDCYQNHEAQLSVWSIKAIYCLLIIKPSLTYLIQTLLDKQAGKCTECHVVI